MAAKAEARKRPSKDQVKAWLATVIAPLISMLRVEVERAARRTWSFRCTSQDFEFLWPTTRVVSEFYVPNLEQFWRYRPALHRVANQHDEALARLLAACRNGYEALLRDEEFQRLAEATGKGRDDWRFFAEYVVNGVRDLDSFYTLNDVWKEKGGEFLGLRDRPVLAPRFKAIHDSGAAFGKDAEALLHGLQRTQQELADEHKLPPVDPVASATV